MALLEVSGITKSFGKTKFLNGIDISLEKGKVLSIIGSSGSGKTTLLRCLNFLEIPADKREEMGKNARRKMENEFDRNIVISEYMKQINAVLK